MQKIKYLLITLSILALYSTDVAAGGRKSNPVELRVGTYNVWRSDLGKDDYRWEVRKERLVKSILDCNIDIFAAEEVDTTIFREIPGMPGSCSAHIPRTAPAPLRLRPSFIARISSYL